MEDDALTRLQRVPLGALDTLPVSFSRWKGFPLIVIKQFIFKKKRAAPVTVILLPQSR